MSVHVAVVGGGVGGLCLAQGLRRNGVSVSVHERDVTPTDRLQGYRLHINPVGARVLHECLPPELWARFVATTGRGGSGFGFLDERLNRLLAIDNPDDVPERAHHSVSRITLREILLTGLDDVVTFGRRFTHYEHADGRITVHFVDGTSTQCDVLVGADGANSAVRAQYLPHAERVDTGITAIAGKLPLTPHTRAWLPPELVAHAHSVIPRAAAGMFLAPHELDEGGYLMWAYAADGLVIPPDRPLRDLVVDAISGWHPDLVRVVRDSPPDSVSHWPIRTSVPVDAWQPTTVTLLGDAIHSMTPMRGIGANTALRDAMSLCRNLVEREPLDAIADYERHMREYGFAAVTASLRSARQFVSGNAAGRVAFKTVLRLLEAVPPLKRVAFRDHGID
ncbi:FAD-dependent oxidoreductase [Saccharothrix deserti]|uniref:FAD-dependent oxidoreductase n=1 Tax=Saccharothrix deserti TaxID=2593674 RepID=UPI00131EAD5C|nr:NAD(P)/FAD-dependent oxidoreductase [Saccharothrix deserti]